MVVVFYFHLQNYSIQFPQYIHIHTDKWDLLWIFLIFFMIFWPISKFYRCCSSVYSIFSYTVQEPRTCLPSIFIDTSGTPHPDEISFLVYYAFAGKVGGQVETCWQGELTLIGRSHSGCFHLSQGRQNTASPIDTWKYYGLQVKTVKKVRGFNGTG